MTARDPREVLDLALRAVLDAGNRPPCAGEDIERWTSDEPAERAHATQLCQRCPVIRECAAAADSSDENFGVWGGRDRTRYDDTTEIRSCERKSHRDR